MTNLPSPQILVPPSGDVTGPASSTDNAIPRFDGAGGKTLQDSGITIDDSNNILTTGAFNFYANGDADDGIQFATATNVPAIVGIGSYIRFGTTYTASHLSAVEDVLFTGATEFDGISYFDEASVYGDNVPIRMGTSIDYWLQYNSIGSALNLVSTNVDGLGTNGNIFSVTDGSDDVAFTGDITVANVVTAGTVDGIDLSALKLDDLQTPDDNTDLDFSTLKHGLTPKGTNVGNFLKDDGTWAAPAGGGDVTGPASSVDNAIVRFNGVTGKIIQDYTSGAPTVGDTGDVTVPNLITAGAVDGRDVSVDGTKLDGIEALADVTDATNVNAAGAVMEADYNAQTILAATLDDTPAALTVAEQTVVGRITGGNIAALTVAQLQTLIMSAALPENVAIILDPALSADGKYSGIVETGTAGAALAFGDLVYLAVADSRWELTDASAAATAIGKIGICVVAAAGDGSTTTILLWGKVRADTAFPALTVGAPVHISETAGDVVVAAPSTSSAIVRIVGHGNTADELHFSPDNAYVTVA